MTDCSPSGRIFPSRRIESRPFTHLRVVVAGVFAVLLSCCKPPSLGAQSLPTASRVADLQIGGGFVYARSAFNFTPIHLLGETFYTTFDPRPHWGGEFSFHNAKGSPDSTTYERTYEVGPRVFIHRGRFSPYAKVLIGRGVYNFHNNLANVAYNIYTFGGGADYQITRSINLRGDYELQNWASFPLGTLHPSVITVGAAFHFHQ